MQQLFQTEGWGILISYLNEEKNAKVGQIIYNPPSEQLVNLNRGAVQTIDAIIQMPEHLAQYRIGENQRLVAVKSERE